MKLKYVAIFLVLLCCLMGATSAAEDVSTDAVDAIDDDVAVDAVSEDTSDSLESVVEDELVVDESAVGSVDESIDDEILGQSESGGSNLGDWEYHDEIYVNVSSENDPEDDEIQGSSWEDAYGTYYGLIQAFENINNDGRIYVADGIYEDFAWGSAKNCNVVGMDRENTIFQSKDFTGYDGASSLVNYGKEETGVITYVNITFKNPSVLLRGNKVFINCTFINAPITTDEDIYNSLIIGDPSTYTIYWTDRTYSFNFTDCDFVNYDIEGTILEAFTTSQVNFNNCKFENVTANSIVKHTGDFIVDDSINFKDCTFNNVNVKGIVDVATGSAFGERYTIEGCTGVDSYGIVSQDGHDYVNSTAKTETALATDIDSEGNLLVSLTAGDNAVANAKVLISVNGGEAASYDLGEDGTLSIALADLADATGKLNIVVTFEETDDYKGSSDTISTVLVVKTVTEKIDPVATAITASDITATAKIAKTLSITLKDANGNALANKAVQVTVNGKTSTVKTDSKGVAKVNVNYAKAGTYYYTLSFLGDNDYKASLKPVKVTVNKQATKATFAKKTFKVKATKKISFTLKDSKGKAIAKKKITFKVNGKTYTAKTNSKGVATVKIVIKKKGKYTAVAKFAGDTTYKAISKKVKITIK